MDNTSDANKPVSTATQSALDLKADLSDIPTGSYNPITYLVADSSGTLEGYYFSDNKIPDSFREGDAGILSVYGGDAATSIGNQAFYSCSVLESVSLPAATSIGDYAFRSCSGLESASIGPAASSFAGSKAFNSAGAGIDGDNFTIHVKAEHLAGYDASWRSNQAVQSGVAIVGDYVP